MSVIKPSEYVRPFYDRTSEHDSPHGSDMDMSYRQHTDALYWRSSGGTRTFTWGYQGGTEFMSRPPSPLASVTAVDTWTKFQIDGEDMGIPWRFSESHERILFYVYLACNADVSLKVRIDSETLLDSVTTATGKPNGASPRPKFEPSMYTWWAHDIRSGGVYGEGLWYSWLEPNVPSNRRIKLVPYVKAPTQYHEPDVRWDISGTVNVWMTSMVVRDVPPRDSVGW